MKKHFNFIRHNCLYKQIKDPFNHPIVLFQRVDGWVVIGLSQSHLTLERLVYFETSKAGVGGFHRKSSNIAIGQFNALKSWPYTSKFTIDHPEQIGTILKSIGGFGKIWGPQNAFERKIQILSDFRFSDFLSHFRFSYLFLKLL